MSKRRVAATTALALCALVLAAPEADAAAELEAVAGVFASATNGVTGDGDPPIEQSFDTTFDQGRDAQISGVQGSGEAEASQTTNIAADGEDLRSVTSQAFADASQTGQGEGTASTELRIDFTLDRDAAFTLTGTLGTSTDSGPCPSVHLEFFGNDGFFFDRLVCSSGSDFPRQATLNERFRLERNVEYDLDITASAFATEAPAQTRDWNFRLADAAIPPDPLECGEEVIENRVLEGDLGPCPEDGLIIGAPGITLDLGGHTITGDGDAGNDGVSNRGGHDDVTIRNGTIAEFGDGVGIEVAAGGTINRLLVRDNFADGIDTTDATSMTIRNNTASDNGLRGFDLECVGCLYKDNFADNNFAEGFRLFGEDLTVTGNRSEFNNDDGLRVDAVDSRLEANKSLTNDENGFNIGGADNTLIENLAESNIEAGFLVTSSDRTKLKSNTSKLNEGLGFNIAGGSDVVLSLNKANENLNGGFLLNSVLRPIVKSNVAKGNTGVGLFFVLVPLGKVTGNTALNTLGDFGTTGDGFSLAATQGTLFSGNLSENNAKDGFNLTESDDNDLVGNTAKRNIGDGFFVADTSEDNDLKDNLAKRNSSAGFRIDDVTTTGRNNRASRNAGGANCLVVPGAPVRCRG